MVQAMIRVQKSFKERVDNNDLGVENEERKTYVYQLGSYIEEDIAVATEEPYSLINKKTVKVRYFKNILRKKHSRGESYFP